MEISETIGWHVEAEAKYFCLESSNDGNFIAAGQGDGMLSLRSPKTGRLSYSFLHNPANNPVGACRFHPTDRNLIMAVASDGTIVEFNTKQSEVVWQTCEVKNELYALAYSKDGSKFATGGKDLHVRVYDGVEREVLNDLGRNEFDLETVRGHCNRIRSIVFHPSDPNLIFSAGWDNSVQIWDMRTNMSVRALFGAFIAGDSMDINDQYLLAGNWRTENQFLIWDLRTFSVISTMQWSLSREDPQGSVCAARFHPNGELIVAGTSGVNQVKMFSATTFTQVGMPVLLKAPVVCLCVNTSPDSVIIGTSDGKIQMRELVVK
jgi:WD40 repeat protein